LVLVHFFFDIPGLAPIFNGLVEWATIIAAFAILLGLVNVSKTHVQKVLHRKDGWPYSIVLLMAALLVLALGLWPGYGLGDQVVQWVFLWILEPLSATFFSLLAFFLASAVFRTLRLRNLEATILTITAVIVLLGQVPISPLWSFLQPVAEFQQWLLAVPAAAGVRAILIGVSVGAIATALRVILGLERPYVE
jgi:hypothetical protein